MNNRNITSDDIVFLHSAASDHFFHSHSYFFDYAPIEGTKDTVQGMDKNKQMKRAGKGSIDCHFQTRSAKYHSI